jgi:hypothetical protein
MLPKAGYLPPLSLITEINFVQDTWNLLKRPLISETKIESHKHLISKGFRQFR